jgi:hypothetical protein
MRSASSPAQPGALGLAAVFMYRTAKAIALRFSLEVLAGVHGVRELAAAILERKRTSWPGTLLVPYRQGRPRSQLRNSV